MTDELMYERARKWALLEKLQRLENALENLGGEGHGLGEKARSLEERLPVPLAKSLRRVAAMRNRLVHEVEAHIPDIDHFAEEVDGVLRALGGQPVTEAAAAQRLASRRLGAVEAAELELKEHVEYCENIDAGEGFAKWVLGAAAVAAPVALGAVTSDLPFTLMSSLIGWVVLGFGVLGAREAKRARERRRVELVNRVRAVRGERAG